MTCPWNSDMCCGSNNKNVDKGNFPVTLHSKNYAIKITLTEMYFVSGKLLTTHTPLN